MVSKEECYKTAIEAPDRIVTDYDGISLPIKVISYGAQQIAYSVDIEGPEWVKSDSSNVNLGPGGIVVINLAINPGEDVKEGNYKAKISMDSEKVSYSKDIYIRLRKKNPFFEGFAKLFSSYSAYIYSIAGIALVVILMLFLASSARKSQKIKTEKRRRKRKSRAWLAWLFILIFAGLVYLANTLLAKQTSLLWQLIIWWRYYIYALVIAILIIQCPQLVHVILLTLNQLSLLAEL